MLKLLLVDGKQRAIDYFDYMQVYPGNLPTGASAFFVPIG
jgi:hypothetical protein